jgi:hypothetical protein
MLRHATTNEPLHTLRCMAPHPLAGRTGYAERSTHGVRISVSAEPMEFAGEVLAGENDRDWQEVEALMMVQGPGYRAEFCHKCRRFSIYRPATTEGRLG